MTSLQNTYSVFSNEQISQQFYRLCFNAPLLCKTVRPGQFVHIRVSRGLKPFFRRPFSVFRAKKHVEIFYEVVGLGTQILSSKRKGDVLDVLGPLGNGFCLPPEGTKQVVMVAGGIGVAPFLILSDFLKKWKFDLVLLYGARTRKHIFDMSVFEQNGCKIFIATNDGSVGVKGRVSKLFKEIRKDSSTFLYTCGPRSMMAAVQDFANKFSLRGQVSCEEVMACGLGACLGCVVSTTTGFQTACEDGPVFDLSEVVFQE